MLDYVELRNFEAAVDLVQGDAVYINTDGKAAKATSTAGLFAGVVRVGGKAGDPVTLYDGNFANCKVTEAVTAGHRLDIDSSGFVDGGSSTVGELRTNYIALEAASAAGDVIACYKQLDKKN